MTDDQTDGLPVGADPSDPGMSNDSSLGADRAAAINAEKKKWRDKTSKAKKQTEEPPLSEPGVREEQDFDE